MLRKTMWGVGLLLMLMVLLIVVSVTRVDYTPYFESDYYQTTITRLDSLAGALETPAEAPLLVGVGQAHITPAVGAPLAGYGARKGRPSTGVHDSLWAKVIALKSGETEVVLLTLDALLVTRDMSDSLMALLGREAGLRRDQVYMTATHSHCGPGAWGDSWLEEQFAGEYDPTVLRLIVDQMAAAVRAARNEMRPASFGFGGIADPQHVRNRLVGKRGTRDVELSVGQFRWNGGPAAVMGVYAAHATALSARVMDFSCDYPGYWARAVESRTPALGWFAAGGVGSHSPAGEGQKFERCENIGQALADSTMKVLGSMQMKRGARLFSLGLRVDLPETHVRITDGWRLRPWLGRRILKERDTYLHLMRLDDTILLAAPGDLSGEITSILKDYLHHRGYRGVFTSFGGTYVGYIIPGKYYHFPAYESRLMNFYGPNVNEYLTELMRRMLDVAMEKT